MADKNFQDMIADTVRNGPPVEEGYFSDSHGLERSNPMLYKVQDKLIALSKSINPNSNLAKGIYKIEPGMKGDLKKMEKLINDLEGKWSDMIMELEMMKSHENSTR